jgi:hypothetical protein
LFSLDVMRHLVTRKPLVAVVATFAVLLIGIFVWQYPRLFPPIVPTPSDRTLVNLFHTHRQAFETLAQMADQDATIAYSNTSESLPAGRRSEYSRLLSEIDSNITMGFDPWRTTKFLFAGEGGGIGPTWGKGIAHLTAVPGRVGQIVHNLDKDPGHDDIYLVPIEADWYVIFQRIDYDRTGSF